MSALNFPQDRDEAGIGTGPFVIGDEWLSTITGITYEVVGFNNLNQAVWKSKSVNNNSNNLQSVLNAGNYASDASPNVADFALVGSSDGKITEINPGTVRLTDETTNIGPRIVFNSTESSFTSRISVKRSDRLILETTNNEGIWINDRYINNQGVQEERDFRIIPNERQFAFGVYSIYDVIFGGPTTTEYNSGDTAADGTTIQGNYTVEDWTEAFNRALQKNPIRPLATGQTGTTPTSKDDPNFVPPSDVLDNGPIKTVVFPAGAYSLLSNVIRKEHVTIVGEGRGVTKFVMEERVEDSGPNAAKTLLWRCPPTQITSDGMELYGQFCLANKGKVRGITFVGHQSFGFDVPANEDNNPSYPDNPDDYENDVPDGAPYSTVLAFRAYSNNGYRFGTAEANAPEYDENGFALRKQNDSADMDTEFVDCGFGSRGKGGDREGILKVVGRNAYISNCSFDSNYNGLVLTFPNRPGYDWTEYMIAQGGTDVCQINQSLSNESQGGIYGWRRVQVLGCFFHMDKKANCILMYGKYQCSGMIIDGNLSDIGGKLLNVCSTGTGGSQDNENDPTSNVYSNGVGGGLKNCIISNNSFGNQTSNGGIITFEDGRYDGNVITGNSFFGQDNTYKSTDCPPKAFKRCKHAIVIKQFVQNKQRGCVVRNLVISNNNFAYFLNSAIKVDTMLATGLNITGNTFLNIGCGGFTGDVDANGDLIQDPVLGGPERIAFEQDAAAIYIRGENTGIFANNMLTQEDFQATDPTKKMGSFLIKIKNLTGSGHTAVPNAWQKVNNNFRETVNENDQPGRFCTTDNTQTGIPLC